MNYDVVSSLRLDARAVQGRAAPAAAQPAGGNPVPAGGNAGPAPAEAAAAARAALEAASQARAQAEQAADSRPRVEPPDFSALVERLNQYMQDSKRAMRFEVDAESGRTVITVLDGTGEVVRQIPPEELLVLSRRFAEGLGAPALVNLRA